MAQSLITQSITTRIAKSVRVCSSYQFSPFKGNISLDKAGAVEHIISNEKYVPVSSRLNIRNLSALSLLQNLHLLCSEKMWKPLLCGNFCELLRF